MKKIWICTYFAFVATIFFPKLYTSIIFPLVIMVNMFTIGTWAEKSMSACMDHYQKHHLKILFEERVQYKKLLRKDKARAKAEYPECLQSLSESISCFWLFLVTLLLILAWRQFFLMAVKIAREQMS